MIKRNRTADIIVGILLLLIGVLTLPLQGCKSVKKSQNSSSEVVKVVKSDSSSSKSYSYVDTTKTDSSTEVTTTTVTIDSLEWNDGLGIGYEVTTELPGPDISKGYNNIGISRGLYPCKEPCNANIRIGPPSKAKAKGVKITTTTIKQATTQAKGVTVKEEVKQAAVKSDSSATKTVVIKQTVKKGMNLAWCWLLLIPLVILAWYKRGWIIEKVVTFLTRWRL